MTYELVIRNGSVIDGSGSPSFMADIGIDNGRITKVGRITEGSREVIDAEGHVVTPGFIDGHTHMDAQVMWDELGSSSCFHGVTTVVMGNCGFTLAPSPCDGAELVVRNIERAEDISADALAAGIDWNWETFAEYLDAVDQRPKAINYASYVGHSALRSWAMGERAFTDEADDDDLALMERGLDDALTAGAIGFSTSRHDAHTTPDGGPVASRLATWGEVCRLVGAMGRRHGRVFELALENAAYSLDPLERRSVFDRIADLAVSTGVPVTFGTTRARVLEGVDVIVDSGGRAFGQTHSRGVASVMSFRTQLPFDVLPTWRRVRTCPLREQARLMSDPEVRRRMVHEAQHGPYPETKGAEARRPDFELMQIFSQPFPPHPVVADEAKRRGLEPVELIIRLGLESDFEQLFLQNFHPEAIDDALITMKHPRTAMTFSDSGAHVSQISDSSIQSYLLGHWVRNREEFTLEDAVSLITNKVATSWGFNDRGLVREGFVADLNVLDPATVGPRLPIVRSDLPGGARRLVQKGDGFRATIVAGAVTLEDGEPTGVRPGRLLRSPGR